MLLSPGLYYRSDWPCESLLHLSSHAAVLAIQWTSPAVLRGKMRNPRQISASLPSHTVIKTATCSRDKKRGKISHSCRMKATYSLMCSCDKNWQWLKRQHCNTTESWEKTASLYSPGIIFIFNPSYTQSHTNPAHPAPVQSPLRLHQRTVSMY